ncbi:MAG: endonuclease/exonuclease/phosphatase family protein [Pirellulaceae bacterium]
MIPNLDGRFDDWGSATVAVQDPSGDALGAFDVIEMSAMTRGTTLFVRLRLAGAIQLQNGREEDGKLILELEGPDSTLRLDFRGRANSVDDGSWGRFAWDELSFVCLPTILSDEYEMQVDLAAAGIGVGDVVNVNCSGSDSLKRSLTVALEDSIQERADTSTFAMQGMIRVANLNTLRGGLADKERGPQIARLIKAASASVYCFQEERDEELFRKGVERCFESKPNTVWHEGCGIVSDYPLRKLPFATDAAAVGVVTMPESNAEIVVLATHLRCCGYAGSDRDDTRAAQARQIAAEIRRLRAGAFGEKLKSAPVVMVGDYNHVGSSRPLDVLDEVGLADVLARCPSDGSAYTWRAISPEETFWPGRLDLITHSRELKPRHCWVFDSERMTAARLQELGLKKEDSRCSDHLMLIADFDVE